MGWWSKDIMGGDAPLDFEDEIFKICNIERISGNSSKLTKEHFEEHLSEILEMLRKQRNNQYYDRFAIGFQVLGVLMMSCGATITDELKTEIKTASETDTWANEDPERKEIINGFHKALNVYNGTPITFQSKGLFEVLTERISSGNKGLINKGKGIA